MSMTIGELARRYGIATHVLRHWEDVGLVAPARVAGQRRYTEVDARQVEFILFGREVGLGLGEMRELFDATDRSARDAVLLRAKAAVEERIARLRFQLVCLDAGLACSHDDFRTCPDVAALLAEREATRTETLGLRTST